MIQKRLGDMVNAGNNFLITAEFVPLPGHNLANFEKFLHAYPQQREQMPAGFDLAGVTIPQSPGGIASMSPADIFAVLDKKNLWSDLDVIPHVTAKDHNTDALETYLIGLQKMGMQSILALTGDKPTKAKGVFEVESVGLIEFIKKLNNEAFAKAKPETFDQVPQFYIAAAVSQYKYTEAAQMQQYFKMKKKIAAGADTFITQLGYDYRKSQELFQYCREEYISVPIFGNVYFLTTMTPAPRLMYQGKLPGCVVTKELFGQLAAETPAQHLKRAAVQVAMFRDLGAVGVDLGGIFDFDMLLDILNQAEQIGANWPEHKALLDYGVKDGFYLYDSNDNRRQWPAPPKTFQHRSYNIFHNALFEPGKWFHNPVKKIFSLSKSMRDGHGTAEHFFHAALEKPAKSLLFKCQDCGDCFLPENFGICTLGRCEKGLSNVPCGDANPDGTCGNNPDIPCVGQLVYEAAASEGSAGLSKLIHQVNPPRNPQLANTSSILNFFFGRDHAHHIDLIRVSDNLHSFIPKVKAALQTLNDAGPNAFTKPSGALRYILSLISGQALSNADYIFINLDALESPAAIMPGCIELIKRYGRGVPPCVDSTSAVNIESALSVWYKNKSSQSITPPMVRISNRDTISKCAPLHTRYPFKIIVAMEDTSDENPAAELITKYGFRLEDIFLELPVTPIMKDIPEQSQIIGQTHQTFKALEKIKQNKSLKGIKTIISLTNCCRSVPGRSIGICRAYLQKAQGHGLKAVITDATQNYGLIPPADDLLQLIDALAQQDGTENNFNHARNLMNNFCQANQKTKTTTASHKAPRDKNPQPQTETIRKKLISDC